MFTGIVEEIGTITQMRKQNDAMSLTIRCEKVLTDVHHGDSIAVNGVCLTVSAFTNGVFTADVMPETVKATTLHTLKPGSSVNLERAMAANGRFGGHFVSGHVDVAGKIISIEPKGNSKIVEIEVPKQFIKYAIPKGSITVDGTSLTLFEVRPNSFVLSLIPVTMKDSVVGMKKRGDIVNVEFDMLAKYMEQLLQNKQENQKSTVTMDTLLSNGFLD